MKLICGNNIDVLKTFETNSIDSIITDPPYELGFMGKKWDSSGIAYNVELWQECLRVLKPGGHLLAFGGTRTYHRMVCAIEDAGFEIRDCIQWLYGSGFPKSHNVANAIDKKMGMPNRGRAIPTASQYQASDIEQKNKLTGNKVDAYESRTEQSKQWQGWGTALKPANEPIVMARKPLIGTVADNVLEHGTGGLNIDATRVGTEERETWGSGSANYKQSNPIPYNDMRRIISGRWPANVILDEEAGKVLDQQARQEVSRFFYCPKPSKKERNAGLEKHEDMAVHRFGSGIGEGLDPAAPSVEKNVHPTVKPIDLMAYLIKLVTPLNGIVLDPFMGSGTTGIAAVTNGFNFIGIDMTPEYVEIAAARIEHHKNQPKQLNIGGAA